MYKSVIDIGTNSFHLIIAEVESGYIIRKVHDEKVVMRLGTESGSPLKHISATEMERAVSVIKKFNRLSEFYNAETYAVATSAVRESDNSQDFIRRIKEATNINVQVITGIQEATYINIAVRNALPVNNRTVLCIDIGGGSTEVIIGKDGNSDFIQSYKLGAVRLSKMFFPGFTLAPELIRKCSEYIKKTLKESDLADFIKGYDIAVGASGTIMAIAAIVAAYKYGAIPKDINGFLFTAEDLKSASEVVLNYATVEERSAVSGIEPGRADILPAGILILMELFDQLHISELTISSFSLREGFLISILSK